jgi:hypothetical protein
MLGNKGFKRDLNAILPQKMQKIVISKLAPDVCTLRLDFLTFVIVGPQTGTYTVASELSPACPDAFTVTVTANVLTRLHICTYICIAVLSKTKLKTS